MGAILLYERIALIRTINTDSYLCIMRRIRTKTFDMLPYVMRTICTTFAFSWLYVMKGTAIIKKGRHFGKTTEAAAVNTGAFLYVRCTKITRN
ncbi:hypothetical protein ACH95_19785 [Bacillus glycinifermentans]|nr:hypothetical protein ACH95_19785 [Bacillus glycinifermentans]